MGSWDDIRPGHIAFAYSEAPGNPGFAGKVLSFSAVGFENYPMQMLGSYGDPKSIAFRTRNGEWQTWNSWAMLKTSLNTTVDTNGNLRPASPVIKLKGDGTAELNEEAEDAKVGRTDTCVYQVSGGWALTQIRHEVVRMAVIV